MRKFLQILSLVLFSVFAVPQLGNATARYSCSDSDVGRDPRNAGVAVENDSVTSAVHYGKDRCQGDTLIENQCQGTRLISYQHPCQYGCSRQSLEMYGQTFNDVGFCHPASVCGNGMVETNEACDDGNTSAGDGCSASCQIENPRYSCEDSDGGREISIAGVVAENDQHTGEVNYGKDRCQGATLVENYCNGRRLASSQRSCQFGCGHQDVTMYGQTFPNVGFCNSAPSSVCGNGVVEQNEACDDGNAINNDGCSPTCQTCVGGCDLGSYCDLSESDSPQCRIKKMVGSNCQVAEECMSGSCEAGLCQKGEAFSLCIMVNDRAEDITDYELKSIIARASDLAAERFNFHFRILTPIYRYDVPYTPTDSNAKLAWLQTCYDDHRNDPPNGFLMMSGDTNILARGVTQVSQDFTSQGYCNRFYSLGMGSSRMIGTDMHGDMPVELRWTLAYSFIHEILHFFGWISNQDHIESNDCRQTLGDSIWDEAMQLDILTQWFSQCPINLNHLAHGIRDACTNPPTKKVNGSECGSNTECLSDLCIARASGWPANCYASQLNPNEACVHDQQCLYGNCQHFRCGGPVLEETSLSLPSYPQILPQRNPINATIPGR